MRDDTRRNNPARSGRNARSSENAGRKTPGETSPNHTEQERAQMQAGLRILARIIARAHLRRQASGGEAEPPPSDLRAGG